MAHELSSVCVYCGSSNGVDDVYKDAARRFGKALADNEITMVYGGGSSGLMGITANACMTNGGKVIGITTDHLQDTEGGADHITEYKVVNSMHDRKLEMFDRSDAFVALPGGLGTLDECFEIMTWKQIGLHQKHIVFINENGYWEPLLKVLIPHMIQEGFVREADLNLFSMVDSCEDALKVLHKPPQGAVDFVSKWG